MRRDLINGVEQIVGRDVIAFLSDNHINPDVAVEVFLLAPADGDRHPGDAGMTPEAMMASATPQP
jgi:hypothetical protein